MIKEINIGNPKTALKALTAIKNNRRTHGDIKLLNSHITSINKLIGIKLFKNNTLYINAETLWDLMQDSPGAESHHYHGLKPEDIYMALSSIKQPRYVFVTFMDRIATVTVELSHFGKPLMIIVDPNSGLAENYKAIKNKIITIYPKDNIEKYVEDKWKKNFII